MSQVSELINAITQRIDKLETSIELLVAENKNLRMLIASLYENCVGNHEHKDYSKRVR